MDKENNFSTKIGRFVGNVVCACFAICVSACVIALTMRFIMWLF